MCTVATYLTKDFYFGRTLDYDCSYGEQIVVTPRNYPFHFRAVRPLERHYAILGMAVVQDGYPLYYDGVNERGLAMAGLNFVGNAAYKPYADGKENVAQFELIPWILGSCATVGEARKKIAGLNLLDAAFQPDLPAAQLHWLIADRAEAIVLEAMADGIRVHHNPVGVLTNNPPFDAQMRLLSRYQRLTPDEPEDGFSGAPVPTDSRGLGAVGLPGDWSSQSRFVRAAFARQNAVSGPGESESVNQFFHILGTVDHPRGCCRLGDGKYEITNYTSCCNATRGIYYYTTYDNHQITAVDMHREDLEGAELMVYPLLRGEQIRLQNG